MINSLQLHLAKVFLKIFLRNRQAILFSLFFPLIFIGAFSFSGGERDPFLIGISDGSKSQFSSDFIQALEREELFTILEGSFEELQASLEEGEIEGFASASKEGLTKGTTAYQNASLKMYFLMTLQYFNLLQAAAALAMMILIFKM